MKSASRALVLALLALPLALTARPAAATTYMMMSDQALADQAAAVVDVEIAGVEPAPVLDGPPATDYLVEVSRVLKGDLPGSTVVVRVPGGVSPDGFGLKIWGAPRFADGERAILFLRPAPDGTYRILHLMLGAFHQRVSSGSGGRTVALRDLSEAHEVGGKGLIEDGGMDAVRDFEKFADWVADRAQGMPDRGASYVLGQAKAGLSSISDSYTFLTSGDGVPVRWFRFDRGQSVEWKVNSAGQPGLGLDASTAAFQAALDVWNSDPGTDINYVITGTTSSNNGLARSDSLNTITFDDPFQNDSENAVEGTFDCSEGGVIAVGGPYFFQSTRTYNGKRYHEAAEADIVTNDGTECFFRDKPKTAEEVFAHELGHTLGLGHSKNRDALMYANAHADGRGGRLTDDDRAGIAELYGNGFGPGPGGSPTNLTAPTRLAGQATSTTAVALTWRDRANGEQSYSIEVKKRGTRQYQEALSVGANSTSAAVTGLIPGATYSFRVRAMGSSGVSAYTRAVTITLPR
jgi:hypothetical protein